MLYLFNQIAKIEKSIFASKTVILMLDFDGTLSPIVKHPSKANISKIAKKALTRLLEQKKFVVAIITGRSLKDIKAKVRMDKLIYAGNHGLEWEISGKKFTAPVPKSQILAIRNIKKQLVDFCQKFKGAWVEDKNLSLTVHFRKLNFLLEKEFKKEFKKSFFKKIEKKLIFRFAKKIIEIRPALKWNKGSVAKLLVKNYKKNSLVVYMGDDATDEDAFKVLKTAVTVVVGQKPKSFAKYFVKNTKQVSAFLATIAKGYRKEL